MTGIAHHALESLFNDHARVLWSLSYRLTGSAADADDVVQETFVRALQRKATGDDPFWKPWLLRVATNLAIDALRRRRRQSYTGAWLPSPVQTAELDTATSPDAGTDPFSHYERNESVSFAFLLALEALTPRQRAVLILRDVMDYSTSEVADVLQISPENVRITHHRARAALKIRERPSPAASEALRRQTGRTLAELLRCLQEQDVAGLEALLVESVRVVTDGGGEFTALHRPMIGRPAVMHLLLTVAKRRAQGADIQVRDVNGLPAALIRYATSRDRQAPRALIRCDVDQNGHITELHIVLATRKLTAVHFKA